MAAPALFRNLYRVAATRLPRYDYGQRGAYFVTLCTRDREPCLGGLVAPGGDWAAAFLRPTPLGQQVLAAWAGLPQAVPGVRLDAFVLMPDHVHGLLLLDHDHPTDAPAPAASPAAPPPDHLAAALHGLTAGASRRAQAAGLAGAWPAGLHTRLVRSAAELTRLRYYILTNPNRWATEQANGAGLYR